MSNETRSIVRPTELIERFCDGEYPGLPEYGGERRSIGNVAYNGLASDDPMEVGFQDGNEFASYLSTHGWRMRPEKGDPPYLIYLTYSDPGASEWAIAEYCEGDLIVWTYRDAGAYANRYGVLRGAGS